MGKTTKTLVKTLVPTANYEQEAIISAEQNLGFGRLQRFHEFAMFAYWLSLPQEHREAWGMPTQKEFALRYEVDEATLCGWKHKPEFWQLMQQDMKKWAKELTPNVLRALYKRSLRQEFANPMDAKLWFQVVEGVSDKIIAREGNRPGLQENDLRVLIAYLPSEKQQLFFKTLSDLIEEAKRTKATRERETGLVP